MTGELRRPRANLLFIDLAIDLISLGILTFPLSVMALLDAR